MILDLLNGLFGALGGLMILNHCRVLLKDKEVKGVSIFSTCFFMYPNFTARDNYHD